MISIYLSVHPSILPLLSKSDSTPSLSSLSPPILNLATHFVQGLFNGVRKCFYLTKVIFDSTCNGEKRETQCPAVKVDMAKKRDNRHESFTFCLSLSLCRHALSKTERELVMDKKLEPLLAHVSPLELVRHPHVCVCRNRRQQSRKLLRPIKIESGRADVACLSIHPSKI